jgi:hypothetical protein
MNSVKCEATDQFKVLLMRVLRDNYNITPVFFTITDYQQTPVITLKFQRMVIYLSFNIHNQTHTKSPDIFMTHIHSMFHINYLNFLYLKNV